jgi:hypothetical protein
LIDLPRRLDQALTAAAEGRLGPGAAEPGRRGERAREHTGRAGALLLLLASGLLLAGRFDPAGGASIELAAAVVLAAAALLLWGSTGRP